MKNLVTAVLVGLSSFGYSQNPGKIFGSKYIIGPNTVPLPLPTYGTIAGNYSEGYEGQLAKGAQNIITDNQGKIVFFIVDEYIYDRKGKLIDMFINDDNGEYNVALGLIGEVAVVPVPDDCNSYYLISTAENMDAGVSYSQGHIARLKVEYDGSDNLLPTSGLLPVSSDNCDNISQSFLSLIGSGYNATNNVHDERPLIAVSPKNNLGEQFLFISNGLKIFKLNITNAGIIYSGSYTDLNTIFPGNAINFISPDRLEMEIVKMTSNNNYRLAIPFDRTIIGTGYKSFSVATLDFDPNGNYLTGSQKIVNYDNDPNFNGNMFIKGIELSPNGSKLYVTHNKYMSYTSTFDMFDLSSFPYQKTIISVSTAFENSQVESSMGTTPNSFVILAANLNTIAAIKNPDTPVFPADFDANYISATITATTPFTPSTSATHVKLLQDQIDYEDYSFIDPNSYDKDVYHTVASGLWQDNFGAGNNPLIIGTGNTAIIQKELRIKEGHTITIKNMIIKFAPGARLVIENSSSPSGQGGKLILDGTTLTQDDQCNSTEMWLGVEVWGNQSFSQGTFSSSSQGRLELINNATIEHAHVGTLLGKRLSTIQEVCPGVTEETVLPNSFDNLRTGGIVQSTNSFYFGNKRGVWFQPYINGTSNNLSFFTNTEFKWHGPLIDPTVYFHAHAQLNEIYGVQFKGSDFINHSVGSQPSLGPSGQGDGYGIVALNSQFFVDARCTTPAVPFGVPCSNLDRSLFKNLYMGISTSNSNTRTFRCDNNDFTNCRYGIYVKGTQKERVTQNNFFVRESFYQSAGLAMYDSQSFTVQENTFDISNDVSFPDANTNSYGIVVQNSGTSNNDIYKNTFTHLKIGGQSELNNGLSSPTTSSVASGLTWTCNEFVKNTIRDHDLTIVGGRIHRDQGQVPPAGTMSALTRARYAARNFFSTWDPATPSGVASPAHQALEHDLKFVNSDQLVEYTHLYTDNQKPDSYTATFVQNVEVLDASNNHITLSNKDLLCPSKLNLKPIVLNPAVVEKKQELDDHKGKMTGGNSSELILMIQTENNLNTVKAKLLEKSPFLQDQVLLAYLNSSSNSNMKKEVLIANSELSQNVLDAVSISNLPNGTKNQIFAAQNAESLKVPYYRDLNSLTREYDLLYNDLMSQTILNDEDPNSMQKVIELTTELGDLESKKLKVQALVHKGDVVEAEELRQEIISEAGNDEHLELIRIEKEIRPIQSTVVAIENQPEIGQQLEYLRDFAQDKQVRKRASYLLELRDGINEVPQFLPLINTSAMMVSEQGQEAQMTAFNDLKVVSVYPNPSTGMVNFDYPDYEEGVLSIQLFDMTGKVIHSFSSESKTNGEVVDLSGLNKGLYIVRISIDNQFIENQKLQLK